MQDRSAVAISGLAIENKIFLIRGQKVMVDRDLAELYGVETKYLNRQVKRNQKRFPLEFAFRLTAAEKDELVTICHRFDSLKHSATTPTVFTEHGVAMLASVLNSDRAIQVSIYIIQTFVRLRLVLTGHRELTDKLRELEQMVDGHDQKIISILEMIRQLIKVEEKPKRQIGFHWKE